MFFSFGLLGLFSLPGLLGCILAEQFVYSWHFWDAYRIGMAWHGMLGLHAPVYKICWRDDDIDTLLSETSPWAFFLAFVFTHGLCDWSDVTGRLEAGRQTLSVIPETLFLSRNWRDKRGVCPRICTPPRSSQPPHALYLGLLRRAIDWSAARQHDNVVILAETYAQCTWSCSCDSAPGVAASRPAAVQSPLTPGESMCHCDDKRTSTHLPEPRRGRGPAVSS